MGVTGKKVQELGIGSRPRTIEGAGPTDPISIRTFYSDFNTVFLLCLPCCLLLVYGSCCLFVMGKMFCCGNTTNPG